jgi:hypothetical protein
MRRLVSLVVALLLLASAAAAQTVSATTGAINGKVADNTGAVLPGVTVTASSPAMMGTRDAVTNEEGLYRFPAWRRRGLPDERRVHLGAALLGLGLEGRMELGHQRSAVLRDPGRPVRL